MRTETRWLAGFTLTELMMVLAIAGILAMLGAPGLGSLLARSRVSAAQTGIERTLRHARGTAVMRNTRIIVCPSPDGLACRPGADWQHGWLTLAAERASADATPEVLARGAALPDSVRIVTSSGRGSIVFYPDGSAAGANARFTVCRRGGEGRSVVLANSGRVRSERPPPERLQECRAGLE